MAFEMCMDVEKLDKIIKECGNHKQVMKLSEEMGELDLWLKRYFVYLAGYGGKYELKEIMDGVIEESADVFQFLVATWKALSIPLVEVEKVIKYKIDRFFD